MEKLKKRLWSGACLCTGFFILIGVFVYADSLFAEEKEAYELEPVVVTAAKMETTADSIPTNMEIITREEIEKMPSSISINEILRRVPGLYIPQFPSGIAVDGVYSARGAEPTAWGVRLLVNGIEFNKGNGYTVPPRIPMNDIERIEIIKTASAEYGDQAVGGVINIVTRTGKTPLEAKTGAVFGDYDMTKYYTTINGKNGKFTYFVNLYSYQSESYQDDGYFDPTTFYARLLYDFSDTASLAFHGSHLDANGAYPKQLSRAQYEADPTQSPGSPTGIEEDYDLLSLVFTKEFGDDELQIKLTGKDEWFGYYPGLDFEFDEWEIFPSVTYTLRHQMGKMDNKVFFGLEYRKHELVTEIWAMDSGERQDKFRDTLREDISYAGYLMDELSVSEALTITAGIRIDSYEQEQEGRVNPDNTVSQSNDAVSPKLGAVYRFSRELNLFAGFNTGFKSPARVPGASYTAGLDPEKVVSYETGLRGSFGRGWGYNLAGFITQYKDKWLRMGPDAHDPIVNAGDTEATGVELGLNCSMENGFFANISYTYQESEYADFTEKGITYDGNRLPNIPDQLFGLLAGYESSGLGQFTFTADYLGKRYLNKENTLDEEGYWLFGAGYKKHFDQLRPGISFFITLENLADEKAVVNGSGTPGDEGLRPVNGRRVYGGIEFSL